MREKRFIVLYNASTSLSRVIRRGIYLTFAHVSASVSLQSSSFTINFGPLNWMESLGLWQWSLARSCIRRSSNFYCFDLGKPRDFNARIDNPAITRRKRKKFVKTFLFRCLMLGYVQRRDKWHDESVKDSFVQNEKPDR